MAVTVLTTTMSGAVNYTVTTASSSDWGGVSNSTYFYDLTDKIVYYKDSTGSILSPYSSGTTIYTGDGTLGGARTVTMAGNGLTFTGGQTTIKGSGTTSATKALSVQNSSGIELMYMPNNGGLVVGGYLTLGGSSYAINCTANFEVMNGAGYLHFWCGQATRNFTFGSNSSPSTGTLVISVPSATAPTTGLTNHFLMYGKAQSVGNVCLHTRTENGAIIKLYQETTAVTSSVFVANVGNNVKEDSTFDGYTLTQVVKALRNLGVLA